MEQKLHAIIIDDEPLACSLLQFMLQSCPEIAVSAVCNVPQEAIEKIDELKPDLIFLDIQMPQITGIELLELIQHKPQVIFTTAYNEHAIKAFDLNAVDYLLKPYTQERLQTAISKVQKITSDHTPPVYQQLSHIQPETRQRIVVKDKKQMKFIDLADIKYLEGAQDYVKIYTTGQMYIKHGTMQSFEEMLPAQEFIRCHRSFIVNTHYIQSIENNQQRYSVILKDNTEIPVSRNRQNTVKSILL